MSNLLFDISCFDLFYQKIKLKINKNQDLSVAGQLNIKVL